MNYIELFQAETPGGSFRTDEFTENLVEVIGGTKPMTVEDYVTATRDEFNHDGRHVLLHAPLPA